MAFIRGSPPVERGDFPKADSVKKIQDYFGCKVSVVETLGEYSKHFPKKKVEFIFTKLPEETYKKYKKILGVAQLKSIMTPATIKQIKNKFDKDVGHIFPDVAKSLTSDLESFFSGIRRLTNALEPNPKLEKAVSLITEHNTKKWLVFSTFNDAGLLYIKNKLIKKGVKLAVINGSMAVANRRKTVEKYNGIRSDGSVVPENERIRVCLISRAGAEGLSFFETYGIIIYEPHWNEALVQQMIARGVRFKSHHKLPKKEQVVHVYRLFNDFPRGKDDDDKYIKRIKESPKIFDKIRQTGKLPKWAEDWSRPNLNGSPDVYVGYLAFLKEMKILQYIYQLKKAQQVEQCVFKSEEEIVKRYKEFFNKNKKEPKYRDKMEIKHSVLKDVIKKQEKLIVQENTEFLKALRLNRVYTGLRTNRRRWKFNI
jgi:hypothetical protein